ncbi:methyltransferase domain-containing protein [Tundrisphaera sp. TA3]|uniref:methyltransferase domain-containing protein n=1 Tax=Tundrisphaera sp. TA3 TaxID=3435775 RepID=UPI003EB9AF56
MWRKIAGMMPGESFTLSPAFFGVKIRNTTRNPSFHARPNDHRGFCIEVHAMAVSLIRKVGRKVKSVLAPLKLRRQMMPLVQATRSLEGKTGLEIGGPTRFFKKDGILPIYPIATRVDNANFAHATEWEGAIAEGMTFQFDEGRPPGRQYVCEAADLAPIPSASYDFLLSSHTIEHLANPLRGLEEWKRVLKDDGLLILVAPHPEGTFDHKRQPTPLAHLIEDYNNGTGEDDLTHLEEILAQHDLSRDPGAGDAEKFRLRSLENFRNRCLHQHVFNSPAIVALVDHAGFQILDVCASRPFNIFVIARKLAAGKRPDNRAILAPDAPYRKKSDFASDRMSR